MPKPNVRDQLITASLATLHRKGFNATSVQDITEAAGVPKGSFYNHFDSKEALGVEVVRLYGQWADELRASAGAAGLPPLERIRREFAALVDANVQAEFACGCMLGNFSTELSAQSEPIRQAVSAAYAAWAADLQAQLEQAQLSGDLPAGDSAAELAQAIIDAWQGAVLRSKAEQSRAPLDRFMKTLSTRLLQ
jgi:TetR/AcrR family transcriptional repressor of nem operon